MALVKCKECGGQVSDKAKTCPNCGAKAPKKTSPLTWFVLILIIFGIWSAGNNMDTTSSSSSYTPASTSPTSTASTRTPAAKPTRPKPAWEYNVSTDKMTGKKTGYLVAYSQNSLNGWLRNGRVLLGYTCGSGFYVRANDVGFAIDDIDCDQYSCTHDQYARVRFDNGPTKDVWFDVWDDNNDGMFLQKKHYSGGDMEAYFVNHMKAGQQMYLELETFQTDGAQQIAEFSLTGFTKAFNSCP